MMLQNLLKVYRQSMRDMVDFGRFPVEPDDGADEAFETVYPLAMYCIDALERITRSSEILMNSFKLYYLDNSEDDQKQFANLCRKEFQKIRAVIEDCEKELKEFEEN